MPCRKPDTRGRKDKLSAQGALASRACTSSLALIAACIWGGERMTGFILAISLAALPRPFVSALPGAAPAALLAAPMIPYADETKAPQELVQSIKARRKNGKLLNLDRMLLNSPEFAKGWNTMF